MKNKAKLTEADAKLAVELCKAVKELPKVRKALTDKLSKYHDSVWLELQAAQMSDGQGQGSDHYFYLPPEIGREVLDAVEKIILRHMERLNVTRPKR